jgi:hypothetical protein
MKKIVFTISILALLPSTAFAALDPELKECLQRGYEQVYEEDETSYCIFPDGNKCVLTEFNNGTCGAQYKNENYCVAEGRVVWDAEKCCPGTEAYLKPYHVGQTSCTQISTLEKLYDQIRYNPFIWVYSTGIIFIFIIFFIIFKVRKRKNSNS